MAIKKLHTSMSLARRIGLGFTLLLIIIAAAGAYTVYTMQAASKRASSMSDQSVPAMAAAAGLERAVHKMMLYNRGFTQTGNRQELEAGTLAAGEARQQLEALAQIGRTYDEAALLQASAKATTALGDYAILMQETVALNSAIEASFAELDQLSDTFMRVASLLVDNQNALLRRDLDERSRKVELSSRVLALANEARVQSYRGQAESDLTRLERAQELITQALTSLGQLRTLTRIDADIAALKEVEGALTAYDAAVAMLAASSDINGRDATMTELRENMTQQADLMTNRLTVFLQGQHTALQKDVLERESKVRMANRLASLGNEGRLAAFRSRALDNPEAFAAGISSIEAMSAIFNEIKAITRNEDDLRRISSVETASQRFRQSLFEARDAMTQLAALAPKREVEANHAVAEAQAAAQSGMDDLSRKASASAIQLLAASAAMTLGVIIACGIGITIAVYTTVRTTRTVRKSVAGLIESSTQVAAASSQVSAASEQLAQGTSEQASSIEECSASLEEVSSMTQQNAHSATAATQEVDASVRTLGAAQESLNQLVRAMGEIAASSTETRKIVKSIDEIAFQTNILALNAAVEAARAGEAGAGFAVVADEVRNLAMRAAEAARTTSDLIDGSTKRIGAGTAIADTTRKAFESALESASRISSLISEIATASVEQSQGIDEVSRAMSQMDSVVQSAAASAEESAAAAQELNAQANQARIFVDDLVLLVEGTKKEPTGEKQNPRDTFLPPPEDRNGTHQLPTRMNKPAKSLVLSA